MQYKDAQKEIKSKTDLILPSYKGKIELGGNIFHRKKTALGSNIILQSILNYNVFPIVCSLKINNDILSYHYALISKCNQSSFIQNVLIHIEHLKIESKNNDTYGRFQISNSEDVAEWTDNLKRVFDEKLDLTFAMYNKLENIEAFLNHNIINFKESDISGIEIFLGLIAAKILDKQYFDEIYHNLNAIFIKNEANFEGSVQYELLNKTYLYLKNLDSNNMNNLEYLKSQLKNN